MRCFTWCAGSLRPDAVGASGEGAFAGHGVFETLALWTDGLPLWDLHVQRMQAAAAGLGLPFELPVTLRQAVLDVLRQGEDVVRLGLLARGDRVQWAVAVRSRDGAAEPLAVDLAPAARPRGPWDAVKRWPRPELSALRDAARGRGAHDVLLWRDGTLLEASAYSVLVAVAGRLHTPPADGSILPGVARALLLASGLPIVEQPVSLAELHGSPLILLANAVYGPRRACLLGASPDGAPPDGAAARLTADVRAAWGAALRRAAPPPR